MAGFRQDVVTKDENGQETMRLEHSRKRKADTSFDWLQDQNDTEVHYPASLGAFFHLWPRLPVLMHALSQGTNPKMEYFWIRNFFIPS
jgi:hypothetical protein